MIRLALGKNNRVGVRVSAPEMLSGFSVSLSACGTEKSSITNDKGYAWIDFSKDEVATVTTDMAGEYVTLTITDGSGVLRLKAMPCFRAIEDNGTITDKDRTIFVAVPKKINTPSSGSSGDTDLSSYATKQDLANSSNENKKYTDEKVSDIGDTIISEQQVTVAGEDGKPQQITVKQAVQNVVDMQTQVTHVLEHHVSWEVKDEDEDGQPDGEILYINSEKDE